MSGNAIEIIMVVLGGAGVAIITAVGKLIKDHRDGRTAREDTALSQWREIAAEHERNADRAWSIVAAYRRYWPRIWADHVALGGDREKYPPDPSHEE